MQIFSHKPGNQVECIPGIKNIVAVGSGKGGVGKSTVTTNLALATANLGFKVGLLDADIYGPSQPMLLGNSSKPHVYSNKSISPLSAHGIKFISIGNLISDASPAVWRGPMVSGALQQLLYQTSWGELDFLFIDLPPGTGDIQLTMSQKIPVTGAIIVTTPQDLALLDADKAIKMFSKVNIAVLGVVENMSVFHCCHCGHLNDIFGSGGGKDLATKYDIELIGKLPLDAEIRKYSDTGTPFYRTQSGESKIRAEFDNIVEVMLAKIAALPRNYKVPLKTVVEST